MYDKVKGKDAQFSWQFKYYVQWCSEALGLLFNIIFIISRNLLLIIYQLKRNFVRLAMYYIIILFMYF